MRRLALLLSVLALGALGLVACGGDDDETTVPSDTGAALSQQEKVELAGNEWAALFAGRERFCELMTQPACARVNNCKGIGSTENCTPPSLEFRKSFEDATVEDVALITGDKAAARFSNGETIELEKVHSIPDPLLEDGDRFGWLIHEWGGNAKLSREQVRELKRAGNDWASLFATNACNRYMGQPMCQRLECVRHFVPIENCTPVSAAFQRSFADATVEDIKSERVDHLVRGSGRPYYEAAVKFSNGEVVVFGGVRGEPPAGSCAGPGSGCVWNPAEPDHNRRFFEAAAPRG